MSYEILCVEISIEKAVLVAHADVAWVCFLGSMPSAVPSEDAMEGVVVMPPTLDSTTGKCSAADADLYLGKILASYPDLDDLFMSSAKVPQLFWVNLWLYMLQIRLHGTCIVSWNVRWGI